MLFEKYYEYYSDKYYLTKDIKKEVLEIVKDSFMKEGFEYLDKYFNIKYNTDDSFKAQLTYKYRDTVDRINYELVVNVECSFPDEDIDKYDAKMEVGFYDKNLKMNDISFVSSSNKTKFLKKLKVESREFANDISRYLV